MKKIFFTIICSVLLIICSFGVFVPQKANAEETFNITIPDEFLIMENIRNYKILFEKIIDLVMKNE